MKVPINMAKPLAEAIGAEPAALWLKRIAFGDRITQLADATAGFGQGERH